jgi:peptidyl-tRNA hydrolase, PTH1 family
MQLVAGLGNPGLEYRDTRHNAGFMLADLLAGRWGATWRSEKKFFSEVAAAAARGGRPLLCKPQTYMNASGDAVVSVAAFYKVSPQDVLVAVDDTELPLGMLRLRPGGSSGGHRGLESVESRLGREFPRLRLGVSRPADRRTDLAGYVLGKFRLDEMDLWQRVLARAAEQVECWSKDGMEAAMNRFNGSVA